MNTVTSEGGPDRTPAVPSGDATVAQRLAAVRARIEEAESAFGRRRGSVTLLAVSKTQPASAVREALAAGQRAFGENHLQEAVSKITSLADSGSGVAAPEWHFIGPIQANKTRPIAARFDWVHSVDRTRVATRLNDQRPDGARPLQVCIQVNISAESTKSGVAPEEVRTLAEHVLSLSRLRLRGLMAIPRPCAGLDAQRAALRPLAALFDRLRADGIELDTLSMGMTDDLEAAIAEGSTMVRVGTAVFGPRRSG